METHADADHELWAALRVLFAPARGSASVYVLRHEHRYSGSEPAPPVVQQFEVELRTSAGICLVAGSIEGQHCAAYRVRLLLRPRTDRRPGSADRQQPRN